MHMKSRLDAWIWRVIILLLISSSSNVLAQRGRLARGSLTSDALKTNLLGDGPTRSYAIYLPPSYDTTTLRYPIIFVLHGYTDNENGLISTMQTTLDTQIAQRKIGELIAVFVNGSNRLKGSFYLNSEAIGDYETYIVTDLVNLIDSNYRSIAASSSRGITGYSMGGWGAMHLALKYPSVFSVVVSEAGVYDSRSTWADGLARQLVTAHPSTLAQFDALTFPLDAMQALFAGLIANPARPSLFSDYPYDLISGQLTLNASAHQRCLDRDVQNGDLPRYVAQPIKLNGIKVVHGTSDSVVPISLARSFTNALTAAAVPFSYEQHTGDHIYRADLALPYLATNLLGGQKYIAPPRMAAAFMTNHTAITFPTQTGVTYNVYSSPQLEIPFVNWTKSESIDGNGQAAKVTIPIDAGPLFVRLTGRNN